MRCGSEDVRAVRTGDRTLGISVLAEVVVVGGEATQLLVGGDSAVKLGEETTLTRNHAARTGVAERALDLAGTVGVGGDLSLTTHIVAEDVDGSVDHGVGVAVLHIRFLNRVDVVHTYRRGGLAFSLERPPGDGTKPSDVPLVPRFSRQGRDPHGGCRIAPNDGRGCHRPFGDDLRCAALASLFAFGAALLVLYASFDLCRSYVSYCIRASLVVKAQSPDSSCSSSSKPWPTTASYPASDKPEISSSRSSRLSMGRQTSSGFRLPGASHSM